VLALEVEAKQHKDEVETLSHELTLSERKLAVLRREHEMVVGAVNPPQVLVLQVQCADVCSVQKCSVQKCSVQKCEVCSRAVGCIECPVCSRAVGCIECPVCSRAAGCVGAFACSVHVGC
jgi:hypothetical protein